MGLLLLITSALYSHGDLPIRIKGKTQEISKDSTNSNLYFERGFLYQQHFEFNKAKCDYLKSKELGHTDKLLNYRIAEVNFSLTDYSSALGFVNQYINIDSLDVKPHKLKAQILIKLNKESEALEFYDFVIKNKIQHDEETYGFPEELEILVKGIEYRDSKNKAKIRKFLRRIPADPMTRSIEWGLRSYQDKRKSTHWGGENIWDIYSKAEKKALNGSYYKEW